MQMQVVTLFPEMVNTVAEFGVVGRAVERGLLTLQFQDPREYTANIQMMRIARSMTGLTVAGQAW
jgi:tRNA (guanine-N1)-methyltransferase